METTKQVPVIVLRSDRVDTELVTLLAQRWLVTVEQKDTDIVYELYKRD